ncbi:hypothetical protein N7488_012161 [Penicillium malachiteum]|nr:hypothetical protein N7488_012161 [Penicillium malachiteum]
MSSIKRSFQIKINDQAVAPVDDNGEDQIQASFGPDAAVFTLTDGRLESNGWYLGRYLVEDRSLLPKRVYWFRKGSGVEPDWIHLVSAEPSGTSYSLLFSGDPSHEIWGPDLYQC